MLKSDALSQLKQLKTDIKASRNLMQGTVKGTGNKFGFVSLDSGKDVFLPPDEMLKVLPGDQVEVEVKKEPKSKTFALIERLISSPTKVFFGKYVTKGSAHFVEADIPGMQRWIFIPPAMRKQAQAKDLVKCRLTQHPIKSGKAQAAILEVLGSEQDQGIEWRYAKQKYSIADDWSEAAITQTNSLDEAVIEQLSDGRDDLTALAFITIDGSGTQDMDDALWAESHADGWRLLVAIADPGALIEPGSVLEKEILKRGNSVYFPGQSVAMMPEKIAHDLASLVAGKKRLAKVVEVQIALDGALKSHRLLNALIKVDTKSSYQEIAQTLEAGESKAAPLQALNDLSQALNGWRSQHALVQNSRDEFYLELNEQQKIGAIHVKEHTRAHTIVEECMVATNRVIAQAIQAANVDSLFAGHTGIREERLDAIKTVIAAQAPELASHTFDTLSGYQSLIRALQTNDDLQSLYQLISKQLSKSSVCARAAAHFGMGLDVYLTFTSPLRKGRDFLLHRQVDALIQDRAPEPISAAFREQLEERRQAAQGAVYDVEQWLKCQYMRHQKQELEAEVVRVYAAGCQVRLPETGIEGFVAVRELEGKHSFNQDLMTLKGPLFEFHLGQHLKVRLKNIDWSRKQLQFEPLLVDEQE